MNSVKPNSKLYYYIFNMIPILNFFSHLTRYCDSSSDQRRVSVELLVQREVDSFTPAPTTHLSNTQRASYSQSSASDTFCEKIHDSCVQLRSIVSRFESYILICRIF